MRRLLAFTAAMGIALVPSLFFCVHAQTAPPSGFGFRQPAQALLAPQEAFALSTRVKDTKTAEVTFTIAKGYYMYRDHFRFALVPSSVPTKGAKLGKAVIPPGEKKFDETFQKTLATHRDSVTITLPVSTSSGEVTLAITSQGCADAGVCYPPETQNVKLNFSPAPPPGAVKPSATWLRVRSLAELDAALATIATSKRIGMLDLYADWCAPCVQMERQTFSQASVQTALNDVVKIQLDMTKNTAEHKAILKRFSLFGPPAMIFYTPDGKELQGGRLMGFTPPEKFIAHLKLVKG